MSHRPVFVDIVSYPRLPSTRVSRQIAQITRPARGGNCRTAMVLSANRMVL